MNVKTKIVDSILNVASRLQLTKKLAEIKRKLNTNGDVSGSLKHQILRSCVVFILT